MQMGLLYIASSAGKMVVTSTITPLVQSTISLIASLRTNTDTTTLQEVITKYDIPCTLQIIEKTCVALKCDKEPLKTAADHVASALQQIHTLLTRIADITASHDAGYISRFRTLVVDTEIEKLKTLMDVLHHRFKLMCDIRNITA